MRVLTLDAVELRASCEALRKAVDSTGYTPDLIVGIRTGGMVVAEHAFPRGHTLVAVSAHRKLTKYKNMPLVNAIIRRLPKWLSNMFRIAEHHILRRFSTSDTRRSLATDLTADHAVRSSTRILVIDDAVDSGNTLLRVQLWIAELNPDAELRFAAIVVTQKDPAVFPEYTLHRDTLIRFPWSLDK